MHPSYAKLEANFWRLSQLGHCSAILQWDEAVMMPEGSGAGRADQLAALGALRHELTSRPELGDWIADAEAGSGSLDEWQLANLREMKRQWQRATVVDTELIENLVRAQTSSEQAWRKLRPSGDWQQFLPAFRLVCELKREVAQRLGQALGISPYDALLDEFEPGFSSADIDPIFDDLRSFLPDFIDAVVEHQRSQPATALEGCFSSATQAELGRQLMQRLGFDLNRGRLDVSNHPFCGGTPWDVRITSRYDENNLLSGLMAVLHETGHGKYEQGLPLRWLNQPVGEARGMAMHESQSLLHEMQIARGHDFMHYLAPALRATWGSQLPPEVLGLDNLYALCTRVKRGFIRVDADEVTYPAHILLRYDIERELVAGKLSPEQIPEAWDAGMQRWLSLDTRGNLKDGCMQDVHWPAGLFGYFPLYTLGAMIAAQLFAAAVRSVSGLPEQLQAGDFAALNAFLSRHVWQRGRLHSTSDLIKHATGSALDPSYFKRHLMQRYLPDV